MQLVYYKGDTAQVRHKSLFTVFEKSGQTIFGKGSFFRVAKMYKVAKIQQLSILFLKGSAMASQIRWGIMGCGKIAGTFAGDMVYAAEAKLAAVGSRSLEKAEEFAGQHGAELAYGSYEELAASNDVDVIYVATPHPFHYENAKLCLENGKSVLCEKPFTLNAHEAKELVALARSKGLFLMEAMWSRFLPGCVTLYEIVSSGRVGKVLYYRGSFGVKFEVGPEHRIFNPDLGGGALLDLGVYPISQASLVFGGRPVEVKAVTLMGETGVDVNAAISLLYEGGGVASIFASSLVEADNEGLIVGTGGKVLLRPKLHRPEEVVLEVEGAEREVIDCRFEGRGYHFQVSHVGQCLRSGKVESEIMSLAETVAIMETMDEVRRQWGLGYPGEENL